jgi:hypothetical protein
MKNLPIYYFKINDYDDVKVDFSAIAMVDRPAIMTEWMAFDEHKKSDYMKFAIQEERRIVTSPILIPDLPIYRKIKDEKTGLEKEFYVAAKAEAIEKLVMKFMREAKTNNIKSTHQQESDKTKGVFMFEMFIADESRGISHPKGFDLPNGTAYASVKVDNPSEWEKVKNGTFNGLSIEILCDMELAPIELTDEEIQAVIQSIID